MPIQGSIPTIEELIIRNTLTQTQLWFPAAPSGTLPLATGAPADIFGAYTPVWAVNSFPGRYIAAFAVLPVLIPNDATYEIEIAGGTPGVEIPATLCEFRRVTSGGVNLLPLSPVRMTCPRIPSSTQGMYARARCSVAGPINVDVRIGYIIYEQGV